VKKMLCLTALCAALVLLTGLALAEDARVISHASLPQHSGASVGSVRGTAPAYCKPCLMYGGDWDPNSTDWVAFGNANNPPGNDVYEVYSPFTVPKGKTWTVTGLFTNNITTGINKIEPAKSVWAIRSKMAEGKPGKNIAKGQSAASFKATGRNYQGVYVEYTALVKKLPAPVTLTAGRYWETVQPDCTNTTDCASQFYYETDNETNTNKVGPKEPIMLSFQNSKLAGLNYVNTCNEGYPAPGCQAMSAGVLGTSK
jgi:hypothetical protein